MSQILASTQFIAQPDPNVNERRNVPSVDGAITR